MASLASSSLTPASSNMTRPGFTTATHLSGEPLPEPMRVSAGFAVTGLCGKMLIHTLPPRLILRVIAIRAASIWRLLIHAQSSDCRPYSPNWTEVCPFDGPDLRPRCCFRCLTRFGSSISLPHLPATVAPCPRPRALPPEQTCAPRSVVDVPRSEEHTSELKSRQYL